MAISTLEYALMAGNAYNSVATRGIDNIIPFPEALNWDLVPGFNRREGESGFEAAAFQKGNDIVIAFAGTYGPLTGPDWQTNYALGSGNMASQLLQAAQFYLDIKKDPRYSNANITLTGHSLGGGLAALMAVFFDLTAYTFDQAPFSLAASVGNAAELYNTLLADLQATNTAAIVQEATIPYSAEISRRQSNIFDVSVEGEVLSHYPSSAGRMGKYTTIKHGATDADWIDLHSQALLIALYNNKNLRESTFSLPYLIDDIFDESLFARPTDDDVKDFLTNLIRYEFGIPGTDNSDLDLLTKFGNDTSKLAVYANAGDTVTEPLLKILMSYYYGKEAPSETAPSEFFARVGGGLQFDLTQPMGEISFADIKGYTDLITWIGNNTPLESYLDVYSYLLTAHRISLGLGLIERVSMSMPNDNVDDFMLGGVAGSYLSGGGGNDFLVGRGADDDLIGGAGNDTLAGGVGNDRYEFTKGHGSDTIIDAQGEDKLYIDGNLITHGFHEFGDPANVYHAFLGDAGSYLTFTLAADSDLVITRSDSPGDVITIKNFDKANHTLGIDIEDKMTMAYNGSDIDDIFFRYRSADLLGKAYPLLLPAPYAIANIIDPYSSATQEGWLSCDGNDIFYASGVVDIVIFANSDDGINSSAFSPPNYMFAEGNDWHESEVYVYTSTPDSSRWQEMWGYDGDDILVGGNYKDLFQGNSGSDVLLGGDNSDLLFGDVNVTVVNPEARIGSRPIFVWGGRSEGTYVMSDYGYVDDGQTQFTLYDFDRGELDGNDLLCGGDGDDFVEGNGGEDALFGSYGSDTLQGDSGSDYLSGGADKDILFGDYRYDVTSILYGQAIYHIFNPFPPSVGRNYDDVLYGGAGNDTLDGGYGDDQLYGGGEDDVLKGDSWLDGLPVDAQMQGNDYLDGGANDDTLVGFGGEDTLLGGTGNDQLFGDNYDVDSTLQQADYLDGGEGDDVLFGYGGDDTLLGGIGNDELYGDDNTGQGTGNDFLQGDSGADYLRGFGGSDILNGGSDNDVIEGDEGNDVIHGGIGLDVLRGGSGKDTFIFSIGDGADVIEDFDGDEIVISGVSQNELNFFRSGTYLAISIADTDDVLWVNNFFDPSTGELTENGVAMPIMIESTSIDQADLKVKIVAGNDFDQLIIGFSDADSIGASGGRDVIHGLGGGDIIFGGAGDDTILGGEWFGLYLW